MLKLRFLNKSKIICILLLLFPISGSINQEKEKNGEKEDVPSKAKGIDQPNLSSSTKNRAQKTIIAATDFQNENELIPFFIYLGKRIIKEIDLLKVGNDLLIVKKQFLELMKENETPKEFELKEMEIDGIAYYLLTDNFNYRDYSFAVSFDEFKIKISKKSKQKGPIKYKDLSLNPDEEVSFSGTTIDQDKVTISNDIFFNQSFLYNQNNRQIYGTSVVPNYSIFLNTTANIFDFIFQNNKLYTSNQVSYVGSNFFNVRKNVESIKTTFAAGDLNPNLTNRNGFAQITRFRGASVYSNTSLDPTRNSNVSIDGNFTLKNISKIEFLNKDSVVFSTTLNPGDYNIIDIPVPFNEVDQKIRITDQSTGEVNYIQLAEGYYSTKTIKPNKYNYNLSCGKTQLGTETDFISGFIETGLSKNTSISLGGRTDFNSPALDLGLSSDLSSFYYDLAFSRDFFNKSNAYFASISPKFDSSIFRFNLFFNQFDENYSVLGRPKGQTELRNSLGVSKSFRFKNKDAVSFRLNYNTSNANVDRLNYSLSYVKALKNGTVSLSYSSGINRESLISLGATLRFGKETSASMGYSELRSRANITHRGETTQSQVEYNHAPEGQIASISHSKTFDALTTSINNIYDVKNKSNTLSLIGSTSVLFSGGRFAVSRPNNGRSFIIVSSDKEVDFSIDGKQNSLFSGVVHQVQPYFDGTVSVANQTEDETISLKNDFFSYRLTEAGGAHLKLEHKKELSVRGYFVSSNGIPMGLYSGIATINGKDHEIITDSNGEFELMTSEALTPGTIIKLVLSSYPDNILSFKIEANVKESYDLEEIIIPVTIKK
jgi:hypothetical protein